MEEPPRFGIRTSIWLRERANPFPAQIEFAERAERDGFDAVFFGDRLLATASGPKETVYRAASSEVLITLSALAARTERLQIGPLVLVVPFRHPVMLAKSIASLDQLSNGRLVLPIGAGWNQAEFDTMGVEKRTASRLMLENLDIMRRLWKGGEVSYSGAFHQIHDVAIEPLPTTPAGPPVWLGSFLPMSNDLERVETSEKWARVFRRIGTYADSWAPMVYSQYLKRTVSPRILAASWEAVQKRAKEAGRSVSFTLSCHVGILGTAEDEDDVKQGLDRFFTGGLAAARTTYTIGKPLEIANQLMTLLAGIDDCKYVVLSLVMPNDRQYALLRDEVVPCIREAWARRPRDVVPLGLAGRTCLHPSGPIGADAT